MLFAKGICWIDDCRIPFVDENINFDRPRVRHKKEWVYELGITWENPDVKEYNSQGRFPANLLVCDDMLNDGVISKSTPRTTCNRRTNGELTFGFKSDSFSPTNDKGTNSRYYDIDKWFDKLLESCE
jgi:hypothetical protein